ncbi:MAG: transcription antitermination factor NusB [Acholeplasmataceae bacterium]|nr:transcription antitermination factor NusB [Acholeplasmataceae bacterium]
MTRRHARELVLKSLFQIDFSKDTEPLQAFAASKEESVSEDEDAYGLTMLDGILSNLSEIDEKIAGYSIDWTIDRMPAVDRNILRIAVYELFYATEPLAVSVAINEAVEVAKIYGTDESAKFINGVLGKMVRNNVSD